MGNILIADKTDYLEREKERNKKKYFYFEVNKKMRPI